MQLGKKNKIQRLKFLILLCCFNISQVILDVVYNHTNEADDEHPYTTSFRGIDNKVKFLPYGYFFCIWILFYHVQYIIQNLA